MTGTRFCATIINSLGISSSKWLALGIWKYERALKDVVLIIVMIGQSIDHDKNWKVDYEQGLALN